jgi:hypothetical protein
MSLVMFLYVFFLQLILFGVQACRVVLFGFLDAVGKQALGECGRGCRADAKDANRIL